MRNSKMFALFTGAALMAASGVAFSLMGFSVSHWYLAPVPVYIGLAFSFWKLASKYRHL